MVYYEPQATLIEQDIKLSYTPTTSSGKYLSKPFPFIVEDEAGNVIPTKPALFESYTRVLVDPADPDKMIHDEFTQYSGYELFMRINYGKLFYEETGEEFEWSGEIAFAAPWITPTWGMHLWQEETAMATLTMNFLEGFGFAKRGEKHFDTQMKNECLATGAIAIPGVRYKYQISWMHFMIEGFYLDDFYDHLKERGTFSHDVIFEGTEQLVAGLRGQFVDEKKVAESPLPQLSGLVKMCQAIGRRMHEIEPEWVSPKGSAATHPIETVVSWVRGQCWSNCGWDAFMSTMDDHFHTYFDVGQSSIAFHLSQEFLFLEQGGVLEDDIRNDPLLKCFLFTMGKYGRMVNDILSLGKEIIGKDYQENLMLITGKLKGKGGARETLTEVTTKTIPNFLKRGRKYDAMLRKKYPNHYMLDKYIYHVYALADCIAPATCGASRYSGAFQDVMKVEMIARPWPKDQEPFQVKSFEKIYEVYKEGNYKRWENL